MDRHNINIVQNTFPLPYTFTVPVPIQTEYTRCYIMVAIKMEFIIVYNFIHTPHYTL